MLAQTDYNALRALKGLDPVDLGAGSYAIQCADYLWEELQGYDQPLSMAGHTLALTAVVGEPLANCLWESANFGYVLVVPDAVAAALPVECRTLAVMTTPAPVPGRPSRPCARCSGSTTRPTRTTMTAWPPG